MVALPAHPSRPGTVHNTIYYYILICVSAAAAEINGTCAAETMSEEHVRATVGNTESAAAAKPLQKARGSTRSPPQTTTTNVERRRPLSLTQIRRRRRRRRAAGGPLAYLPTTHYCRHRRCRSIPLHSSHSRAFPIHRRQPFFFLIRLCIQGDLSDPGGQYNRRNRASSGNTKSPVDLADEGCCRMSCYSLQLFPFSVVIKIINIQIFELPIYYYHHIWIQQASSPQFRPYSLVHI